MHTFMCVSVSVSLSQYKWTPAEWGQQEHRRVTGVTEREPRDTCFFEAWTIDEQKARVGWQSAPDEVEQRWRDSFELAAHTA